MGKSTEKRENFWHLVLIPLLAYAVVVYILPLFRSVVWVVLSEIYPLRIRGMYIELRCTKVSMLFTRALL